MLEDTNSNHCITKWKEPTSIIPITEPYDYPVDAFPPIIGNAVLEVQNFTKAPTALIASSALAAISLASQALYNVARSEQLVSPVALFFLTIADSGERKSTCDFFFTEEIRRYDEKQKLQAQELTREYVTSCATWETKRTGFLDAIKFAIKNNKDISKLESALQKHDKNKPLEPKIPSLLYSDFTPEALAQSLARWPSAGILSAEAGTVFGSHGMNKDSIIRNLAQFNTLWDGCTLRINRRTSESFTVNNARLTQHLQVQETTLTEFLNRSGALARGIGFLARFLISWPISTQGKRFFSEPPKNWPALTLFNHRIASLLNSSTNFDENGSLSLKLMKLSKEAKNEWIIFSNAIEAKLGISGEFYDIRDVANKAADIVARLAALLQILTNESLEIDLVSIQSAIKIVIWHLNEAKRFFNEFSLPEDVSDILKLGNWLIAYCKKHKTNKISSRDLLRLVTPAKFRRLKMIKEPLQELIKINHIREVTEGKRKEIHINPQLLN